MHVLSKSRWILTLISIALLVFTLVPGAFAQQRVATRALIGPKAHYLALGDSLSFGYQPDLNYADGYVDDFYSNLRTHGTTSLANLSCPDETSITFLNGTCTSPLLRKFLYIGSQLQAAVNYLNSQKGQVSPVTLDIGANDVDSDINTSTCVINVSKFNSGLATLDANLKQTILPQLAAAMTVNGQMTGDLIVMNYYDPFQNICPNTVPYAQELNQHLANDVSGFATLVDVFSAFGGATTPNSTLCSDTWMCSIFQDIHATDQGYRLIADTFESTVGY